MTPVQRDAHAALIERAQARLEAAADPFVTAVLEAFPGAELLEVRQNAVPDAAPAEESEEE